MALEMVPIGFLVLHSNSQLSSSHKPPPRPAENSCSSSMFISLPPLKEAESLGTRLDALTRRLIDTFRVMSRSILRLLRNVYLSSNLDKRAHYMGILGCYSSPLYKPMLTDISEFIYPTICPIPPTAAIMRLLKDVEEWWLEPTIRMNIFDDTVTAIYTASILRLGGVMGPVVRVWWRWSGGKDPKARRWVEELYKSEERVIEVPS
ncbi:hypothetical protein EX30DRAFT_370944 [Ascodesmis nigricans]|uniref:Uncharacterized protein n=1 Tax=Ascodesmis nigricans TaxID=341454 RepID=A0A4S2MZM9_9PEZI|nr:hypothetical protein EX30DRAFT_370944 [Ascodesmis nigricans]